jgi:ribose transport system substrate-binding protein
MVKNKKTLVLALIAVVSAVSFFGCAKKEKGPESMTFALLVPSLDNPYFVQISNSFQRQCKELGVEATVADSDYDAAKQYTQFENYMEMGVTGMYICPVDEASLLDITDKAIKDGIIVVGFAQGISNAISNFISDDYGYGVINGTAAATWINEKLGGKAEVLLITLDHQATVKLRGDAMVDVITKECPNAVIVSRQHAENMETAMKITETVLQAYPNLNAIACVNDQLAIGAMNAVKNMGVKNDLFYIGGADYTAEGIAAMKEPGSYFRETADVQPDYYGAYGARKIYEYATEGIKHEKEFYDIKMHWQGE